MDHYHTDNGAEIDIGTEDLCGAYRNKNRQEGQSCVGENIQQLIELRIRHFGEGSGQTAQQSAEKTRGNNSGNDRNKDIAQGLDSPLVPGGLGGGGLFDIVF